jgi:L-glyceraldehyde 3-phosphate reductase
MALAWVLRWPVMTSALMGTSSVAQLENNYQALAHLDFDQKELQEIEQILSPQF